MSQKEFIKTLDKVSYNRNPSELFNDFCEMSASTIALPFHRNLVEENLKRLHNKYNKEEIAGFDKCFSILVEDLEQSNTDYLGEVYGELELSGRGNGDFFTPYHISLMIAQMTLGDLKGQLKEKHYLTIGEPASGSGGMVIACRQVFIEQGCNPSWDMFVQARDINSLCFYMCYLQLSLYGLSAEVIHGDSLCNKDWKRFYTPVVLKLPWAERMMFHSLTGALHKEDVKENNEPQIRLF